MRIAIQQPALPAYRVPFFRCLAEMAENHDVTVFYGSEEPALKNADPQDFKALFEPFREWQLPFVGAIRWHAIQLSLVRNKAYDLVVLSSNTRAVSFWLALLWARVLSRPVAIWGHGYSTQSKNRLRSWLRSLPMIMANAVVLYDDVTAERLLSQGFMPEKLYVAPNGLDAEVISQSIESVAGSNTSQQEIRNVLGLGNGPVMLYVGRLQAANRLDLLIHALPQLQSNHPDIQFVVIGSGGAEKARLEGLSVELKVSDCIRWIGSLYDEKQLAPWMLAADVFVYPAKVGLSLVHAFNYGLPAVVCGPLDAHNPEIALIQDGGNSVVASELSANALAVAVGNILSDHSRLERMGTAAKALVRDRYNVVAMATTFTRMFDDIARMKR